MIENVTSTAVSADGTVIAFGAVGEGEPLVIVDGATAYPAVSPQDAQIGLQLADEFRTYTYDRRGRGQSSDTAPYAVAREIDDLAAVLEIAGAPATVFGWSSGALLALDAAAASLPISHLVLFEPPVIVDDSRPPVPTDYVARLDAAVGAGMPGDAAELFLSTGVGLPAEAVAGIRASDYWPALEAVAPTIAYDGRIMGATLFGGPLPADRWASVMVPTLVLCGTGTFPFIWTGSRALADLLPTARWSAVAGEAHNAPAEVLVDAIRGFVGVD